MGAQKKMLVPVVIIWSLRFIEAMIYLALLYVGFGSQNPDTLWYLFIALLLSVPVRLTTETFIQAFLAKQTYGVLRGNPFSVGELLLSLFANFFKLFSIGIISTLVHKLDNTEKKGFMGFIAAIVTFFVKEVWDLVSNFGIPAIMISNASWNEFKERLVALKNHSSEVIAGVIGIDVTAGLVVGIFGGSVFLGLFGGGAIGYYYGDKFPDAAVIEYAGHTVNLFPSLFLIGLGFLVSSLMSALAQATKSIYFSILYTSLNHQDELSESYQALVSELMNSSNKDLATA